VFDFDGVIANSEPLHLRAFQDVLADAGVTLTDADYYAHYLGFDDPGVFRAVDANRGARFTREEIDALVARKSVRLEALERDLSLLFPGAADAIRRLASAVPLAIASGARGEEIRRALDREQLTSLFAAIVPASDGIPPKPAPDPYLRAVAQLSVVRHESIAAGDCVAIEDSMWGLQSARAAGLKTVAVSHTYPAPALVEADLVVVSLHELTIETLSSLYAR
jgi:beta-phosphoglucomutase-like phosphatase (HAD superfamily)